MPRKSRLRNNNNVQTLCCKIFVLKYFRRTSTLRKFSNTKISYSENFPSYREQYVVVNRAKSSVLPVVSGVPGSFIENSISILNHTPSYTCTSPWFIHTLHEYACSVWDPHQKTLEGLRVFRSLGWRSVWSNGNVDMRNSCNSPTFQHYSYKKKMFKTLAFSTTW